MTMASYHEEEDPFEEDIVFDQAGLLNSTSKMNTAIRRVSSGKCVLFAKTLGLCGAFFGLGLCIAIPGPTFLSPLMELESSLSPISNIYVARTSGYIVGSIIGGVLFDRFNRLFLLFLSLLLTAVFITITPWCRALWILESCMIILGITMGFLDTGGNVLCLDLWGRNSGPFMQALHFSFGLGAIVAPLLAAPFLEPTFANSSLTTEFSRGITEFPVHLVESSSVLYYDERSKREAEGERLFSSSVESVTRNISNALASQDIPLNTTGIPPNYISSSEFSAFSSETHSDTFSNPISTPSTSAKPHTPKHKPSKTDASKLGNENWDKVRVGKPPASDLLPLSTTPVPPLLYSSFRTVAESTTSSLDNNVSSVAVSSSSSVDALLSLPSTSSSILEQDVTVISNNNFSSDHQSVDNVSSSSIFPGALDRESSESIQIPTSTVTYDSTTKVSSILNDFIVPVSENSSISVLKNNTSNNSKELNRLDFAMSKFNNTQNLFPRNEGSSQLSLNIPSPLQESQQKGDEANISVKDGENVISHRVLENFIHNSSNVGPDSRESYQEHKLDEMSIDQTTSGGDVLYNVRKQFSDTENNRDLSNNSNLKSSVLNRNSETSENTKSIESYNLKTNDEDTFFRNSEISSTYNSVPSMTKVQHEEVVSISSLDVKNTLPISIPTYNHPNHVHHKPGTFDNDTEHINTIFDIFANRIEKYGFNKIQFTYLIVGIFVFLISLIFLGFLCHNPRDPKSKQEGQGDKNITNKVVHKLFIALMALFFFLYMGLEVTYGQLVLVFSTHSNLKLSQSTGSLISIVFWSSFAAMRFASIFFASGFSPLVMLLLNFVFCTTGTILVSALANHLETALWVGTVLIGVGLASMFPTGILWIERYIHITNKVAAVFVIGVALGEMICPVTIYQLMVIDPILFMYAALVINIICIFIFASLWWLASRQGEKYSIINNNGYQLANQHDEEEDMMDMSPSGSGVMPRRHCFSSEHRSLLNGNMHRGP